MLPREVDLRVEVDPALSPRFRGEVTHRLELLRGTRSIELHAEGLVISRPRLRVEGRRVRARVETRPDRSTVVVHAAELLPAGPVELGLYEARAG